jgi:NADP-dependent 3-hydroxy acid dehydrogenase YdfG
MPSQSAHALVADPPVWLITGCSTGFGREIARLAVERGLRTVVTARNPASLEGFAAAENALLLELDVTKPEQIASAMRAAEARFDELRRDFMAGEAVARAADFPKPKLVSVA